MNAEPEFVAETLKWCNKRRADQGRPPLEKLPKGRRLNPRSCPCGLATGLWVEKYFWYLEGKQFQRGEEHHLPPAVKEFIRAFDYGLLPDYEEEEVRVGG